MFMSARWLAIGRLGIREVVLPLNRRMRLIARTCDHFVGCRVYMDGHFGFNEFAKAIKTVRDAGFFDGEPPVFVDIGANIGTHTLYALDSEAFSRTLSVEPSAENFEHLCRNLAINRLSTDDAVRAAFSSQAGTGRLALSGLNFGDHRVIRDVDTHSGDPHLEEIELVDLSRLSEHAQLPRDARFMFWVDTQGHEYEVLCGIPETTLARSTFVIEYWPSLLQKNGTLEALNDLIARVSSRIVILQTGREIQASELRDLATQLRRKPGEEGQLDLLMLGGSI